MTTPHLAVRSSRQVASGASRRDVFEDVTEQNNMVLKSAHVQKDYKQPDDDSQGMLAFV